MIRKTGLVINAVIFASAIVYFVISDVSVDDVPSAVQDSGMKESAADNIPMVHSEKKVEYISDGPSAKYLGGLENLSCLMGMRLKLKARFSHESDPMAKIEYYRDGSRLDGDVFDCDGAGYYKLQAKLVEKGRVLAVSPNRQVMVEGLPEELEGLKESDHVHF